MIKKIENEYREGDLAIRDIVITFFCIPIYKYRKTSTNNKAVQQLTVLKPIDKIKGFNKTE